MKKYIGKIILMLSFLFCCGLLLVLISLSNDNLLGRSENWGLIALLLIATGHFLALYRIIDLLEKKPKE
ncbi:MAG: hypothetical protein E7445_06765 [Ruminococcaceae bacterium]|nr:hypothetical protein [Oscillospiraceae bacterium]